MRLCSWYVGRVHCQADSLVCESVRALETQSKPLHRLRNTNDGSRHALVQKHAALCEKGLEMPFLGCRGVWPLWWSHAWRIGQSDCCTAWAERAEWRRAALKTIGLLFTWTSASHTHTHTHTRREAELWLLLKWNMFLLLTLSQMEVSADRFLKCVCVGNGRFSLTRDISAVCAAEAVRLTLVRLYKCLAVRLFDTMAFIHLSCADLYSHLTGRISPQIMKSTLYIICIKIFCAVYHKIIIIKMYYDLKIFV